MDICFATLFEDFRHKRSLIFLLSKTDPGMIEESRSWNKYFKLSCFRKSTWTKMNEKICGCIIIRIVFSVF